MDLWTAVNKTTNKRFAASSDKNLRERILTVDPVEHAGDWDVIQGSTATDKTRVLELIEGADPIQTTLSTATYYVDGGAVTKRREKGK